MEILISKIKEEILMKKNWVKELLFDESGYSTVEILIIIAAIGGLVTAVMSGLKTSLVGNDDKGGATQDVGDQIESMISEWNS